MKDLYNYFPFHIIFSDGVFAQIICTLVLMIGCLSIIIGHKYACIDRLLFGCMISYILSGFLGYFIATNTSDYSITSNHIIH